MNSLDVATKEALRRRGDRGRGGPRGALRGAHRHRSGLLRRPGPQGARRDPAQRLQRLAVPHRRRALQPDRARRSRRCPSRWSRRSTASRPEPGPAWPSPATCGSLADTAGFNLAFAGVALSCDTGSSWTLPRLVGRAKALELLYFPRTVDAAESLELGLATQVVPAERAGAAIAPSWRPGWRPARRSRTRAIRQSVAYSAGHDLEESLAVESSMMQRTGATADHGPPSTRSSPRRSRSSRAADRGQPVSAQRRPPSTRSTWRGAPTRSRCRPGRGPYSTVTAVPEKRWLYHMVIVPWQTPPQVKALAGRLQRPADPAGEAGASWCRCRRRSAAGGSSGSGAA